MASRAVQGYCAQRRYPSRRTTPTRRPSSATSTRLIMNQSLRNLAFAALAAALPLVVSAQSSTSGSSTGTSQSGSSQSGATQSGTRQADTNRTGTRDSGTRDSTTSTTPSSSASWSSTAGSSSAQGSIARIKSDAIDRQFTATDLIGKEVYDNGGEKVGEVKDVVLGSAAGSHLAMAFASGKDDRSTSQTGATGSTYGSTSGSTSSDVSTRSTGSTSTGTRTAGTASTGTRSTTSGTMDDIGSAMKDMGSKAHAAMSGLTAEPAAIVSVGGFMGMGDNLIRVPLSQLNYDSSNERLTIAMSQNEISSLAEPSESGAAAE